MEKKLHLPSQRSAPVEERDELFHQLDSIFHPRSVAIVGLPRGMKMGKLFLLALQDQGFPGPIYPVHPEAREIDGLEAFPSVGAVPGAVDLAIVLVPHDATLAVLKDCAAKGVKGVVLFTAGYKETATDEGRALEDELARLARSSGMRLFGPNCMGLYSPASRIAFFPGLSTEPGGVGLVSHSGSLANILARMAPEKGIRFSKAASLGNECDVCSTDLFHYLGRDPETTVIGAYLEGIKDGRRFHAALAGACREKPVVLWKVGRTEAGSRAAFSHTGALAGSREIWDAVVRQSGAIPVFGFEALVDALMGFTLLPAGLGARIAILSGPGGLAVAAAEACAASGLALARLAEHTRNRLAEFVPPTGTSLQNPVDVGLGASLEMDVYIEAARALVGDPGVDALAVVGVGLTRESNELFIDSMIRIRRNSGKPVVLVNVPGMDLDLGARACQAGVPFFDSVERAMDVYAKVRNYQVWRGAGRRVSLDRNA